MRALKKNGATIPKVTLRILRGAALSVLVLLCCPSQSRSANRKGTYDFHCSGYTFRLAVPRGSVPKDELTLILEWNGGLYPPAWVSPDWHDVKARVCPGESGKCEDTAIAKIQFDEIGKHISGSFMVEFANRRQEGKFKVKYHHQGPRVICE
jgi:hypothetical protein